MSESETGNKWGITHVHASFNNMLITVTDITGAGTIVKSSGDSVAKQDRDEASPYAAIRMVESVADQIKTAGIAGLHVRVRGPGGNGNKNPGPGAQTTIRALARVSLEIGRIEDVTLIPHDGTRAPKNSRLQHTMVDDFQVEFIEREDRHARFVARGLTPALANGIRQVMVADVPTFSIDTVQFVENTSAMFDEMIGLRLGLVPLTTPLGDLEPGDIVTAALKVDGSATAYFGDIESADDMIVPADKNILTIELKKGQRLEFEADTVLGHGKDHVKSQGGVAVGYRHLQRVEVIGDVGEFDEQEPNILRGIIEKVAAEHAEGDAEDGDLAAAETFGNGLAERYPGKEVEVHDVPGTFIFSVETDGSLDVDELVTHAVASLGDRAVELEEKVAL